MPNLLRDLAEGEPLYTSWISVYEDDVSGNQSKQWNKHINIYFKHANLGRVLTTQDAHIHFASSSPHASSTEQVFALRELIRYDHTYHC